MQTTNIYVLIDPETNEVRYVGKANNVSQRYKAHLNRARKHQIHKKNWIESLRNKGLKPIIIVIDEVPVNEWIFWETYWIAQMKSWGFDLINYTMGGDGCTFGNQTSFKQGAAPWNKGKSPSTETRLKIGAGNKNKILSESTKQKMSNSHQGKAPAYMKDGIPENIMEKMRPTQFQKGNTNMLGYKHSELAIQKMKLVQAKKAKIVIQYTVDGLFVNEFDSLAQAAKTINGFATCISAVCHGRIKTYKNYIWTFKN